MINEGFNIYIVEDACGATSQLAHDAAIRRCVQAGAVPMTTIATVLEFQRDWANREHYDALLNIFREHGGAYGDGIDYAPTPWCTRRRRRLTTLTTSVNRKTKEVNYE
jgi:nicotinamidase-related amidase